MALGGLPMPSVGKPVEHGGYVPYVVAVEQPGVLKADPYEMAQPIEAPGLTVLSGKKPNHKGAGVLQTGGGDLVVVDVVAAILHNSTAEFWPTEKAVVEKQQGTIQDASVAIMEFGKDNDRFKILGLVVDAMDQAWFVQRMRERRRASALGSLAVVQPDWLLELEKFDAHSDGHVEAKVRRPVYSFR